MRRVRRLVVTVVAMAVVGRVVTGVMRANSERAMTRMMDEVMPRMMDRCFTSMPAEQRAPMLARCRQELDRIEATYVRGETAPGPAFEMAPEPAAAPLDVEPSAVG